MLVNGVNSQYGEYQEDTEFGMNLEAIGLSKGESFVKAMLVITGMIIVAAATFIPGLLKYGAL